MMDQIISHFEIIEEIGSGGMGIVYKARDIKLDRLVALKFLPHELIWNSAVKKRFVREARAASALDHPNICTIYEINESEQGQMFIAMAYYDAETLKQKIEKGSLPIDEAIHITLQICQALSKAHKKGLVHRDIKPANILITKEGLVKIVDFGLAKLEGQTRLTKDHSSMGTVAYMSPEQLSGEDADHRADIWALGVMLYEMLTGQLPFKGDIDQVVIYSILHENPISPMTLYPEMPEEIELVIEKALQKETEYRYQHIDQMEKDLKKVTDITISVDRFDTSKKKTSIFFSKKIKKITAATAILLGLFLTFLIFEPYILKKSPIKRPIPIAIISFQNQTGNEAYDYLRDAIPNLLITSLEQSPYLRVTTWERMYDLLKQIDKTDIKVIDSEIGFELCRLDGIDVIITGSYVKAENVFMTDVKVLNVSTKEMIKSASSKGEGVASILRTQIDDLSKGISQGIGLSGQAIKATQVELAEVTTSSLDAYRNFLQGRDKYEKSYWEDAVPFLKKAVELDSTFAMAYLYLGRAYEEIYNITEKAWAFNLANKYSHKATEKERLYIEETNLRWSVGEKKINILNEMAIKYPKEKRVHYKLGYFYQSNKMLDQAIISYNKSLALDPNYGSALKQLAHTFVDIGNYDRAMEILKKYNKIYPDDVEPLISMGDLDFRLGELEEAIVRYGEGIKIKPDFYSAYLKIAYCYALMEDYKNTLTWINQYAENSESVGAEGEALWWTAYYQYWLGQFSLSISSLSSLNDIARTILQDLGRAMGELLLGSINYECQNFTTSRTNFKNAFEHFTSSDPLPYLPFYRYHMGIISLEQGQFDSVKSGLDEIRSLLPEMKERYPWHEGLAKKLYHILQAEMLLTEDRVQQAISITEKIIPEQIHIIPSVELIFDNMPFCRDVLARAYLRAGEQDKAIIEYENLIRFKPDSKDRRLIYPVYHYHLAKLYQETNQTEKALAQYQRFLELWKNADPDLPELIDTKKRLKKLTEN